MLALSLVFANPTESDPGRTEVAAAWNCLQNMYQDLTPRGEFAVAVRRTAEIPTKGKPTGGADSDADQILRYIRLVGHPYFRSVVTQLYNTYTFTFRVGRAEDSAKPKGKELSSPLRSDEPRKF